MYIDFTNVFIGLLIVLSGIIAVFSTTQLYRVVGTIATFMLMITTTAMPVLFIFIITGALGVHSFSENFKNIGRYNYILLILMVAIMSPSLVEASSHDSGGGLPNVVDRVELVEEVLMITQQPSIDVKGTDYIVGDIGKLQSYLKVGEFPVSDATCFASALYPNMTYFLENVMMTPIGLPYFEGLYYYDFIVPNTTGIYPVNSHCFYSSLHYEYIPDSYFGTFSPVSGVLNSLVGLDGGVGMSWTGGFYANETLLFQQYNADTGIHYQDGANALLIDDGAFGNSNIVTAIISDSNIGTSISLDGSTGGGGLIDNLLTAHFDELTGNISDDSSSYNNDGTIFGNPNLTVTGIKNSGYGFDELDDYVVFPNSSDYIIPDGDEFMVCIAINNLGTVQNDDRIISMRNFDNNDGWFLEDRNDAVRWTVDYSGSGIKDVTSSANIVGDAWHTICVYSNSTGEGIYIDGVFDVHQNDNNVGTLGTALEPIFVGSEAGTNRFWGGEADEVCILTADTLNKSDIAQRYNDTLSCDGLFNEFPSQALTTQFNIVSDGISNYELTVFTPDNGINYTVFAYLDNNSIDTANNITFATTGLGSYDIDVTSLVNLMTFNNSLPDISFRLVNDAIGEVSDIELDRTIINFTTLNTCQGNYCSLTYDFSLPIGYDDEFLFDSRIFLTANSSVPINVSLLNVSSGNYSLVTVLGAGLSTLQIPYTSENVVNDSLVFLFDAYDFMDDEYLFVEQLEVTNTYNGSYVYSLRGNSELVVSQGLNQAVAIVVNPDPISVFNPEQLAEFLILIAMIGLFMAGQYFLVGIIGIFYGFTYYDGLATMIITAFSSMMIVISMFRKNNQQ